MVSKQLRIRPDFGNSKRRWLLDGPYGRNLCLERFENVVLAAKGIGIVGILPFALALAKWQQSSENKFEKGSHNTSRLSTKRVDIL